MAGLDESSFKYRVNSDQRASADQYLHFFFISSKNLRIKADTEAYQLFASWVFCTHFFTSADIFQNSIFQIFFKNTL